MSDTLQWLNIALTSGVLLAVIGAAVAYGKLTQRVEDQGRRLDTVESHLFGAPVRPTRR